MLAAEELGDALALEEARLAAQLLWMRWKMEPAGLASSCDDRPEEEGPHEPVPVVLHSLGVTLMHPCAQLKLDELSKLQRCCEGDGRAACDWDEAEEAWMV